MDLLNQRRVLCKPVTRSAISYNIKYKTNKMKTAETMQTEIAKQINNLKELTREMEQEMWYFVHADAPHKAAKVKQWNDKIKEQISLLKTKQLTNA